jgi:ubiquinone biosynthesis protein
MMAAGRARLRTTLLDLRRVNRLVWVAARDWTGPALRWLFRRPLDASSTGVRLRQFCEEMGITYIKLGQFLAARYDLLPLEVCQELTRLFESVEPMTASDVRAQIERELGRPIGEVFAWIDDVPLGSASVAQVHRARTREGEEVALKVQRPGVREVFEADMRNLSRLAETFDRLAVLPSFSLREVVGEFAAYTRREMNFVLEGATAERVRREAAGLLTVPRVYPGLTTTRLLTMEYAPGISVAKVVELVEAGRQDELSAALPGVDLREVMERLAAGMLHQLFGVGFFQADPHPGNVLIQRDGTVVLVDFGIFGELDAARRDLLARYVENLTLGNIDEAYRLYTRLLTFSPDSDVEGFRREAQAVMTGFHEANRRTTAPPAERHLGRFGDALLVLLHRYRIRLDVDTLLFWRALYVMGATSLRVAPTFDLQGALERFFASIRPGPAERALELVGDRQRAVALLELGLLLPGRLRRALSAVERSGSQQGYRVQAGASPAGRRAGSRPARRLALLAVATSLGILGLGGPWAGAAAGVAWIGAGILSLLVLRGLLVEGRRSWT